MQVDPVLSLAELGDLTALQSLAPDELRRVVESKDDDARTAFHRACVAGHLEVARFLLEQGADILCCDDGGWTPLHSCSSKGDASLVELLLEKRAEVDAVTGAGVASIHFAASKGHMDVLQALVAAGAKKNVRDKHRSTPLLRAAGTGRTEALRLLLNAKADARLVDAAGDNVLHASINGQHIGACEVLMACDAAEELMLEANKDEKRPADLLLELHPQEMRDTLTSVWRRRGERSGG
mmetsp:Transcript_69913/g.130641  ORF Transcript_69913/g.130641 Transcript_69913/m.130641 type:complete len:238 (+) Transcript_69913:29-742(+)